MPLYYLAFRAENQPLIAPQVTLTDGQRTLVLQGMVHVGSEEFYKSVVTYGAEHIPGLLTLLEGQPQPWQVLSAKWSRALSAPREYAGHPLPGFLPGQG